MKVQWQPNFEAFELFREEMGWPEGSEEGVKWLTVVDEFSQPIAVAAFHNFTECNCEISLATLGHRTLASPRILRELLSYPFDQLGLRRLTAVVRPDNHRSLEQVRRMGFLVEGLVRNWYPDSHGILLGLLREDCKWAAHQRHRHHQTQ